MHKLAATIIVSLLVSLGGASYAADKKPAKPEAAKAEAAKPAGKEVTLKGTLGCGKCAFNESKQCENVLKVKEGGKETAYHLVKNPVSDANHEAVCHGTVAATVKGTVADEGGKKVLTASEIKVQ